MPKPKWNPDSEVEISLSRSDPSKTETVPCMTVSQTRDAFVVNKEPSNFKLFVATHRGTGWTIIKKQSCPIDAAKVARAFWRTLTPEQRLVWADSNSTPAEVRKACNPESVELLNRYKEKQS